MHKAGIRTTVRRTRGDEIDAACGQLAGDVFDRTKRSVLNAAKNAEISSLKDEPKADTISIKVV